MRDTVDISRFDHEEISPLIPDPPIKQPHVKQRSNCCHLCWDRFTCCSKWTCILITILVIILILIIVRSVLPFGWPWWFPALKYDASDPHIIVIVADDIGWGDLGYGGAEFPTTNIDQLRQKGISLNRLYAHESGSATRAALLTGVPGYALGLQDGIETGSAAHIPLDVRLLPEILKSERGYATHMVGKWSLGYSKWEYTPTERGFDSFLGFHQRYIDYWHYAAYVEEPTDDNEMLMGYDLWHNKDVYMPSSKMQYATEVFDEQIDSVLEQHVSGKYADQPLFMFYSPPNAHAPIQYHYEYDNECSYIKETSELIRWKYCNLMQELDSSVGHLVSKLKETGMWDRTVLLFTSDNGGLMCWDVGSVNTCSGSVNLPLRGGKGTLFEGALRVRSLISGGYIDESLHGTSSEQLMHTTDLFSTLAEAANVDAHVVYGVDPDTENSETDTNVRNSVQGITFWKFLTKQTEFAPTRSSPFIADLKLDLTSSYIERAAVFWKGYKYIIQPVASYDGWWQSPLAGSSEMPSDSKGVSTEPQPLPRKVGANSDSPLSGQDTDEIEWSSLKVNEYLFEIEEDPAEIKNLRMSLAEQAEEEEGNAEALQVLMDLRAYLQSFAAGPRDHANQDSTTSPMSDPNQFGNVWYPFEEEYRR